MFSQIANIFRKEWLEILRDHRTLISLLIMALMLPIYIYFLISLNAKRADAGIEVDANIVGSEQAPNLVQFLEEQGVVFNKFETREAAEDSEESSNVLMVLPPDYAERYKASLPATVDLYVNQKNDTATGNARELRVLLRAYEDQINQSRMIARGVSPLRVQVFDINDYDLTTAGRFSNFFAGFILYTFIFTAFGGTIASAADLMAGEKERHTLQPLLAQPVTRHALVIGKWLVLALLGAVFCLIAFLFGCFVISKAPLEAAGATFYIDPRTMLSGAVSLAALALFATSLQICVASWAKTYREAMTYVPITAIAPFVITFVPLFTEVQYDGVLSFIPIFNQTFVLRELLLEGAAPALQFFAGIVTTIACSLIFLALTMIRFGSEKALD